MAVIIQADPFERLIRKIGYSVGLEELVERINKLVSLYVKDKSISFSAFENLVETGYGRKRNAAEHFANFYGALNLIRLIGKGIEPLYKLDVLSILKRILESDNSKFDSALKVVLTQCIVEEDGDIFINGLLSDFKTEDMKRRLETMRVVKRQQATEGMRTPHLLKKVYQKIDINNQSAIETATRIDTSFKARFAKRTERLDTTRRTTPLNPLVEFQSTEISDDYLDKASKTRKSWATDLGFFRDGAKTNLGTRLLHELERCVYMTDTEPKAALFWGYTSELSKIRLQLQIKLALAVPCEAWDLLDAIALAFCIGGQRPLGKPLKTNEVFSFLQNQVFKYYRESNTSKMLIRNSLPLYVAEPVLVGWCVANQRPLPDLGIILEKEFGKKTRRRVQKINIRETSGGLFFMK